MKIVTTNFRIEEDDYRMLKTFAAEEGVSVNEYLKMLVKEEVRRKPLGAKKTGKRMDFYDALLELATEPFEPGPMMGLSKLDKEIYE
jgi:hypothetical protein